MRGSRKPYLALRSLFCVFPVSIIAGCEPPAANQNEPGTRESVAPLPARPQFAPAAPTKVAKPSSRVPTTIPSTAAAPAVSTPTTVSGTKTRTWKSSDGAFSVEAELLHAQDGSVSLRRADGTAINISLEKLSAADQGFVIQQFPRVMLATAVKPAPVPPSESQRPPIDLSSEIQIRVARVNAERALEPPQQQLQKLERAAQSCSTAVEALALYQAFLATETLPAELKLSVDVIMARWKELAASRAVRLGKEWVEPTKAYAAKSSARDLSLSALQKIQSTEPKSREEARANLKSASDLDPTSVTPSILTGIVYAAAARNYELAHAQLTEALRRNSSDVSALNNQGVVELRLGRPISAMTRWQRAAQIAPTTGEVVHNIRRLLSEVESQTIGVQPQELIAFRALAKKLEDAGLEDSFPSSGWLYLPPLEDAKVSQKEQEKKPHGGTKSVIAAQSTGFVVAAGHVLTRLENAAAGDEVWLGDPVDPLRVQIRGAVLAVDTSSELCLIRSDELRAPALPLCLEFPRVGTNVGFLNYPEPAAIGQTLTAVRGVVAHKSVDMANALCVCNISTRLGDGAIPVLDASGRLIAVATACHDIGGWRAFGIPTGHLNSFISQYIPSFQAKSASGEPGAWEEIDRRASRSIVLVSTARRVASELCAGIPVEQGSPLEDRYCNTCSGTKLVNCPVRGCSNGRVLVIVREVTGRNPATGQETFLDRPTRVPCQFCNAAGKVDCPTCETGFDPKL